MSSSADIAVLDVSQCKATPPWTSLIALTQTTLIDRLPTSSKTLFDGKTSKKLTFEAIAKELGRSEVAVAALFYGQARASPEDVAKLAVLLDLNESELAKQLLGFPDRGRAGPMPPVEPLIYRLYEIVQNYGYAYKAVLNEKFGDGIMSAISFSTKVEKETDDKGVDWAVITLRGKWYVLFCSLVDAERFANILTGFHFHDFRFLYASWMSIS